MRVYLASPHQDDAWRAEVSQRLHLGYATRVEIVDPIARRDFRGREIENENEIVHGDLHDIVECDVVLGNYSVPGWGTGMESWFARSIGRPVVAYVAPEGRVSPWVAYVAGGYANVHRALSAACDDVMRRA